MRKPLNNTATPGADTARADDGDKQYNVNGQRHVIEDDVRRAADIAAVRRDSVEHARPVVDQNEHDDRGVKHKECPFECLDERGTQVARGIVREHDDREHHRQEIDIADHDHPPWHAGDRLIIDQASYRIRRCVQQRRSIETEVAPIVGSLCNGRAHPRHCYDHKAEHGHLMVDRTRHSLGSPRFLIRNRLLTVS